MLAVALSAGSEELQFVLQAVDPLHQRGAIGPCSLLGLPDLVLVPALHLCGHCLEEALRHLQRLHVGPLLSKRLLSEHLWGLSPPFRMPFMVLAFRGLAAVVFLGAAVALCGRREAVGLAWIGFL